MTGMWWITLISETAKEAESLMVSSTSLNPAGVTKEDVVGGVDTGTGKETGLELVRQIYPKLGLTPGLLLAPGWSHDPWWPRPSRQRPERSTEISTATPIWTLRQTARAHGLHRGKDRQGKAGRKLQPRGGILAQGGGG